MSVTRDDLAESVWNVNGFPKKQSKDLVDSTLELIKRTLASGEDVLLSGFGKFEMREKSARRGRNPKTGEALVLDARRVMTFKPSGNLRETLNGGPNGEKER